MTRMQKLCKCTEFVAFFHHNSSPNVHVCIQGFTILLFVQQDKIERQNWILKATTQFSHYQLTQTCACGSFARKFVFDESKVPYITPTSRKIIHLEFALPVWAFLVTFLLHFKARKPYKNLPYSLHRFTSGHLSLCIARLYGSQPIKACYFQTIDNHIRFTFGGSEGAV